MKRFHAFVLPCASLCTISIVALSCGIAENVRSEPAKIQFCWAIGKYDDTVYYDEIEGREDRAKSFVDFVEVMGIVHKETRCITLEATAHISMRAKTLSEWRAAGLSPVHATFLSDLDY